MDYNKDNKKRSVKKESQEPKLNSCLLLQVSSEGDAQKEVMKILYCMCYVQNCNIKISLSSSTVVHLRLLSEKIIV